MDKNNELKKRVFEGSFWSLISSLFNRAGALIFSIILARFLLPEKYGLYSIVLSVAMIFVTLADLGINSTFSRYIASSLANNSKKANAYYNYIYKVKLFLTLTSSICLLILAYPLSKYFFHNYEILIPLLISAFYILTYSLEGFYTNFFYISEKIKYAGIKEFFSQFLRIILCLIIFYTLESRYYVSAIFLCLFFISAFISLLLWLKRRKLLPSIFSSKKYFLKIEEKKQLNKFTAYMTLGAISGAFFSYIDAIIIGLFISSEYTGYYRAASTLVLGISGLFAFYYSLFLPLLSKLNLESNKKIIRKTIDFLLILVIPCTFALWVLGKYILVLLYGYDYLPSSISLYILSPLIFLTVFVSLFSTLFTARGKPEFFVKTMIFSNIINIVFSIIFAKYLIKFSPMLATSGVAIAALISWLFYLSLVLYYSKKEFDIFITTKSILKPILASVFMSIIVYFILNLFEDINYISGIFIVIVGIFSYVLILGLLGGIKKKDLVLMGSFIAEKINFR